MPILTEDIKLLKSAVMADVPEGGGAMTGIAVVDGQSNNLFPDTSALDRAFGRTAARKLFGVAHSDDTDTLLGAHAIVTDAPDDPLVHCTLLKTAGWADTRLQAVDSIQKYLVKGPRFEYQLYDTHYSGSMMVRLISTLDGVPPSGGEALVLRNPNGDEQYIRILKAETAIQNVALSEGGALVLVAARVAFCTLGSALEYDFLGPPAHRTGIDESAYAQVFYTNISGGAKFYGIKPLGVVGAPGDYSVMTAGGIFTPLVPAATVESPLIDIYPLTSRQTLSRTAAAPLTLPPSSVTLNPGSGVTTPTPIEPGSFSMTHNGVLFTDDGTGVLKQGTDAVGTVSYGARTVSINPGAPSYGAGLTYITYRPATVTGAGVHSLALTITTANQGLVFTHAFEPPPAPGTLTVSYMALGRWYDLQDNANGKLSGSDSGYGVGTVNYVTGSMGLTLGAIPDVGSALIYQWGDASAAVASEAVAPNRLMTTITTDYAMDPTTVTLNWERDGSLYSAASDATGALTGHATGQAGYGQIQFSPDVFPGGEVDMTWSATQPTGDGNGEMLNNGGGSYTLLNFPIVPGSVALTALTIPLAGMDVPSFVSVVDNSSGSLIASVPGASPYAYMSQVVGSVNYATGEVILLDAVTMGLNEFATAGYKFGEDNTNYYQYRAWRQGRVVNLVHAALVGIQYRRTGTSTPKTGKATPTVWGLPLTVPRGFKLRTTGAAFTVGGEVYTAMTGALALGWDAHLGKADNAAAGTITDTGTISITSPPHSGLNAVVLSNMAMDKAQGLTIGQGVFRIPSSPLKVGVFQIQAGATVGTGNDAGVVSGAGWGGTIDYQRGIVRWNRTGGFNDVYDWDGWQATQPIAADELSYNAVFLQYLPLDKTLLGLDTIRLPLDGKVPIYRAGDLVVVHNTLPTQLPNPIVKGTVYPLGRTRLASLRVKDALGALVPSSLYLSDLTPGTIAVPAGSDITAFAQPFTVEHRIEDLLLCAQADISGQVKFTRALTHDFPAGTSFVSSALPFGDMFARVHTYIEQETWTGAWSDELIGTAPLSNFNEGQYPITLTNRGAIDERWALIFTSSTAFRVVGESVGIIGTGTTGGDCAPLNPATGAPYFTLPEGGWGAGWSVGNVLRFNTAACGAPFWVVRTVLQGPASLDSDRFSLAFRGDVDRP